MIFFARIRPNRNGKLNNFVCIFRMENFSQIMDPDYASIAYQNETNIAIGEILAPAVDTNPVESAENNELFATIAPDANDSTNIPEQIFEESLTVQPDTVAEPQNTFEAIETNPIDAVDSIETPQLEPVSNETDVPDASADVLTADSVPAAETSVQIEGEKKDGDDGEGGEDEGDDSTSLMVPDENTKRKDAIEEEINKNQCRICLSTDNLVDIYKTVDAEKKLQICDLVTKLCPSLRIHERDYLPQFVCDGCEDRLNKAYELKLQCEGTDRDLRAKLPRRKRKARSATEFVLIDCNDLSSGSEDDDKDQDDDEFHLSEVISSSSELDTEVSSEEEVKRRPPSKRARKQPPKPPPQRKVMIVPPPVVSTYRAPTTSKNITPVSVKLERIDANRKPVKRVHHYQCSICRKTFTDKSLFSSHVEKHREEKERTCGQCRHIFATINELQKHMKSHHTKQQPSTVPTNNVKRRIDPDTSANGGERDLFKTVAPLTTTYWSDSFSD